MDIHSKYMIALVIILITLSTRVEVRAELYIFVSLYVLKAVGSKNVF